MDIVALNFAREDREKRHSEFAAFGEVAHFKGLSSCIVFCLDCSNINFCSVVW